MRKLATVLGLVLGLFLIGRAIAEPFAINVGDPATYRNDWGGPGLAGVLAVHCGPGLLAAVVILVTGYRWLSRSGPPRTPRG